MTDARRAAAEDQRMAAFIEEAEEYLGGKRKRVSYWGATGERLRTEMLERLDQHTLRWCMHMPSREYDGPRHIHAFEPDYVACEPCAAIQVHVLLLLQPEEDTRCDGCREVFPDGLFPYMMVAGPYVLHYGLCDECSTKERASQH